VGLQGVTNFTGRRIFLARTTIELPEEEKHASSDAPDIVIFHPGKCCL
jgi:hypothetical protein